MASYDRKPEQLVPASGRVRVIYHRADGSRLITHHRILSLRHRSGSYMIEPLILFNGRPRLASEMDGPLPLQAMVTVEIDTLNVLPGENVTLPRDYAITPEGKRVEWKRTGR